MEYLDQEIIKFISENYAAREFVFWGRRRTVTPQTDLRDDLNLEMETAECLMDEYFTKWNVDSHNFNIQNHFHPEFLGTGKLPDPHQPLTVGMLIESAKAGRWLYD